MNGAFAESKGFEPLVRFRTADFKSTTIDHSDNSPKRLPFENLLPFLINMRCWDISSIFVTEVFRERIQLISCVC